MSDSTSDLTDLINQIVFGTTDQEATPTGGVMGACGLAAAYVVNENDPGERPGYPFMTFMLLSPGSEVQYGPPQNPYREVIDDPDNPDDVLLVYRNARRHTLRLYYYGQQPEQHPESIRALANKAQRYLESSLNRELDLLGMDARVVSPGDIRDATTVLNDATEIRMGIDVPLLVGETYTMPLGAFADVTIAVTEEPDGEEEEKEITI